MKQIQLHTLTLHNWRGEKERTTEFNIGNLPTYICGDNGLGKSRHFDAFCWLLFGKDCQDRKDFELRTHDADGKILHRCECSVEAAISIDGELHTLKREYKEQWVKPRGQVEEVFKGNITECTWDGVPVKVNDYQKRVQEQIIDDTLFKMLTNPRYFTERMKWTAQRECLLQMAGTSTDEEIAATKPEFRQLLDTLKGKSLADFRKEIAAEKKRLKAQLAEVQPRIDQTQKMMPEAEDWAALEFTLQDDNKQIADIDDQIASSESRDKARTNERTLTQQKIYDLQAEQRTLVESYKQRAEKDAYQQNEERRNIEAKLKTAHSDRTNANIDYKHAEERIAYLEKEIKNLDTQLDELRGEWREINASAYDGSNICPHCGQALPQHMIANAEEKFKKHKADLLAMNQERGKSLASQRKGYAEELQQKHGELATHEQNIKEKDNEIAVLYDNLNAHPNATPTEVVPTDIASWNERQQEIEKLQAKVQHLDNDKDTDTQVNELQSQRTALQLDADSLKARLAKREQIDKANKEIERLTDDGRKLAQQIADIEKREFIATEFSKKKIEDCEQRINGMFERVRFQLFDTTQDGNEFEVCIPLVDGTPYGVANTASQVNAGLDIIRTLCRFNNVCAPIFIDGAESVNRFLTVPSQVIFLQVTSDKELVIK